MPEGKDMFKDMLKACQRLPTTREGRGGTYVGLKGL